MNIDNGSESEWYDLYNDEGDAFVDIHVSTNNNKDIDRHHCLQWSSFKVMRMKLKPSTKSEKRKYKRREKLNQL